MTMQAKPAQRRFVAAILAGVVLTGVHTVAEADLIFNATLTGAQEVPPNISAATGFATFSLNNAQTALTYSITISGLDFTGAQTIGAADNLTAAHIHCCAGPGVNAGVVFGFFGAPFNDNNPNDVVVTPFLNDVGGTISGKWDAPEGNNTTLAARLPGILANQAYLNFHTVQFPGGEIRGQIIGVANGIPEPATLALIGLGFAGLGFARHKQQATCC